ncbi:MAG: PD-(D/E)XK nuclease family protein, partial [Oscillospiraceae bacterium]|nr:PD-(D/E)XK nuclease family protein [Oscillospiraceae bacterium]
SEQLYLTYPSINAKHELTNCSVMIEEILRIFPENSGILQTQETINPDYYAWTLESAYFHFVRNLQQDTSSLASLHEILKQDVVYASKIEKLFQTQTEQNISISPEIMRKLIGDILNISPSSIEKFYKCPFQYFCMHCLRLYMPEQMMLSGQNIGNFAHHCLEEILKKYDIKKFLALSEAELKQEINILSENFSKENFSDTVRRDGRFQLNYRMTGESILQLLKHMQEELKENKFTPIAFEKKIKSFSMKNGQILCHGKIDRVDICETGNLFRVVDYKTSEKSFLPERLADGLDLQMLIYLFILEETKAYGKKNPSAVLYMPSGQPTNKYKDREENKEKSPEEILEDYYRMKGLLLDSSLDYVEQELKTAQTSVMESNKKELFSVTQEQMQSLKQFVYQKISDMADKLYAGEIEPNPNLKNYKKDKEQKDDYSPCDFCQCKDFCGKAQTDTYKLTKEERQQALETVFGKDISKNKKGENEA